MVGTAHRKGQLPPGLPLEMTCPPSPSLFGIQFPGGGFFDAGRSATRAPTHPAATRSAANSQFRVFLAFWECTFVRFRWSPRDLPLGVVLPWRVCSGFAHGRPWAYLGVSDVRVTETGEGDVVGVRLTSNLAKALYPSLAAIQLLERLLRLYEQRSGSPLV
jgi:hypothetical protein